MKQLSESILDLLKDATITAAETQNERLAVAALADSDGSTTDGLIRASDTWVYQSIMHGLVQSGALKSVGKDALCARIRFRD